MPEEKRFRELLEAAPDAIMQVDEEGRIVLLNRVTEDMFGYPREELLGQPVEVLIPPNLLRRTTDIARTTASSPTTRTMGSGLALRASAKTARAFRWRSA